jgi:hypothetical protein
MVAEGDGLGRLQVGKSRHDEVAVRFSLACQGKLQGRQGLVGGVDPVAHIEAKVGRHLVVAGAGGVQPRGRLADQLPKAALDVHVHVLQRTLEDEGAALDFRQHAVEAGGDLPRVVPGDDALLAEHGRVRLGGADVLGRQGLVEADGGVYLLHDRGWRRREAPTPHLVGGFVGHGGLYLMLRAA